VTQATPAATLLAQKPARQYCVEEQVKNPQFAPKLTATRDEKSKKVDMGTLGTKFFEHKKTRSPFIPATRPRSTQHDFGLWFRIQHPKPSRDKITTARLKKPKKKPKKTKNHPPKTTKTPILFHRYLPTSRKRVGRWGPPFKSNLASMIVRSCWLASFSFTWHSSGPSIASEQ
jgi:hypothetical protein